LVLLLQTQQTPYNVRAVFPTVAGRGKTVSAAVS
jgi:hypothetical protein